MNKLEEMIKYTKDLTLLYVEDDKDARDVTLMILEELFDNIIVAVDGEDGFEKFKENNIDLIITDINMPKMNGLEMSKYIKQIDLYVPIIVLTAFNDVQFLKDAIHIGIDSFINKPLEDIDELINKLDIIIKRINNEKANLDNEKAKLILKTIQHLSHHWRQPLSIISTIASGLSLKYDNNISFNQEDYHNLEKIVNNTQIISNMFNKIQELSVDNISIEELMKITTISNPQGGE